MKKSLLAIVGVAIIAAGGYAVYEMNKPKVTGQEWFRLENITYDKDANKISGNNVKGAYLGEMEAYLPDTIDTSKLEDGQTIEVLGGPGMTMSIPPQLMGVTEIKIVE